MAIESSHNYAVLKPWDDSIKSTGQSDEQWSDGRMNSTGQSNDILFLSVLHDGDTGRTNEYPKPLQHYLHSFHRLFGVRLDIELSLVLPTLIFY